MKQAKKMPVMEKKEEVKRIMERVKSFEEACKEENIDPNSVLPYENPETDDEIYLNTVMKMTVITRALNEGREKSSCVYFPYFRKVSSGFVFAYTFYDASTANTTASASRLCKYHSDTLARYAGQTFVDLFEILCEK